MLFIGGGLAVCRFEFKESLIVRQMVQTLDTSANILHVCIHNNVLTAEMTLVSQQWKKQCHLKETQKIVEV